MFSKSVFSPSVFSKAVFAAKPTRLPHLPSFHELVVHLCHLHSFSFKFSVEHMHFTLLSLHTCFADTNAYFQLSLTPEKSRKEKDIFGFNVQQIKVDWSPNLF